MAQIRVYHDTVGQTLTIWFGDPQSEQVCEETGRDVILMKDETGTVIGIEKLNFTSPGPDKLDVVVETLAA